ncbi:cell division site-positioning protein MapZ family protein [Vagococcus silagei]|uniref:Uncharacterized protein n=1 Tax=Vagococcus silagei TaxID=2508885 RepID=A0A4S3B6J6_9ENTE|nr:cell division site-positioning protein MapZ family protein [Vagococcus silagei]THB61540.1 hypothetical protein ESZ54_04795 [Vagococcus silagei]
MPKAEKKCPNCGHILSTKQEFCPECDLFVPLDILEESEKQEKQSKPEINETTDKVEEKETIKEQGISDDTPDLNETIEISEDFFKHRVRADEEVSTAKTSNVKDEDPKVTAEEKVESVQADTQNTVMEEEIISETDEVIESTESEASDRPQMDQIPIVDVKDEPIDETHNTSSNNHAESQTAIEPIEELSIPKQNTDDVEMMMPQEPKSNNNVKKIIGAAVVVAAVSGGAFWYQSYSNKQEEKENQALVIASDTSVKSLFYNSEHVFLKDGLTESDIEKAEKQLDKIKAFDGKEYDELAADLKQVKKKFKVQSNLNDLFYSPVLDGNKVNLKAELKTADSIKLEKIAKPKDAFEENYNEALEHALTQEKEHDEVQKLMVVVFDHDDVVTTVTREQYDKALAAVTKMPDSKTKDDYKKQLDKVKDFLEKQEKANQKNTAPVAQTDANTTNQYTAAPQQQNQTPNYVAKAPTAVPGQRWGNREDSYKDFSNPAWGWNPGVQEKFIQEVLQRGYVVEGGYSLVPKYIENGEGYYDLYATTNSRLFPKSKPEEFPIYLVTVNVKSGWFIGNGPN